MALLNDLVKNQSANRNGRQAASTQDRPDAQTWMNIGYETEDGKFVNLPLGIAIDTMEPVAVRGQDDEWIALQTARNELLKAVQAAGDDLAPGATITLNLQVQVRRVNDKKEIATDENPYSMAATGFKLVG